MKQEIKIPQMGESVTEATISEILKISGSHVLENDELIELETEKVNQVLYAPCAGILNWSAKQGETLPIGEVIGYIDPEEKALPSVEKEEIKTASELKKQEPDIETHKPEMNGLASTKPEPLEPLQTPSETRRRMTKIRQTIANRLVEALHSSAMLTTFNEVDMSAILEMRTKYKEAFIEKHGVKLGLMSFFVKATVDALKKFPDFNSYLEGEEIVTRHYYHIGIAVGTQRGLVVPVVKDCEQLSLAQIEKEIVVFAEKARGGKLSIEDMEGGGFTITNGGVYGSMLSTPILNPPQVGILGMHKIMKRAIVIEDEIRIRPMMYLALSYDHRIVDGKEAVTFLVHVKEVLEDPSRLLLFDAQ